MLVDIANEIKVDSGFDFYFKTKDDYKFFIKNLRSMTLLRLSTLTFEVENMQYISNLSFQADQVYQKFLELITDNLRLYLL